MAISPFAARPPWMQDERARTRVALALATMGIAASLLAYAVSPAVRHAVGHAAHSMRRAVGHVLDRDSKPAKRVSAPAHRAITTGRGAPRSSSATSRAAGGHATTTPTRGAPAPPGG